MLDETKLKLRHQKKNRTVLQMSWTGVPIEVYYSVSEAHRQTNISRTAITNALRKKSGLQHSGGFLWKYFDEMEPEGRMKILKEIELKKLG